MKKLIALVTLIAVSNVFAQCDNPFGWVRVGEKYLSINERVCIYERDGVRLQIIVRGFCPLSPC